jgi:hypothetical protein
MSGRGSGPLAGGGQVGEREPWPGKPQDDASKTKWSRRDLLTERPRPLGWLPHSRSTRQVIGWTPWLALGPQELEEGRREEPRGCVPCAR